MDSQETLISPHVLIFPLPLQGPVNCMLKLAQIISLAGDIHVTFLNTHHIHTRLLRYTDILSRFAAYPNFRFQIISDGLPEDHPRSVDRLIELFGAIEAVTNPLFRDMLTSGCLSSKSERPVTCIIADGLYSFALDVSKDTGVPLFYFETVSPCGLWTYWCVPKLIEAGQLPFKGDDLDEPILSLPGTESFLRRRDLPRFCRADDILANPIIQMVTKEAQQIPGARGLILNTFENLESPVLSQIRTVCSNIYSIGPLHTHLKTRLPKEATPPTSSNGLWEEDKDCMTWLDQQPPKSVVFVSIGSLAVMTRDHVMEFLYGLVNSGKRFLWVIRPGSVSGEKIESPVSTDVLEVTKDRGCIVGWAPQEDVLAHPAIGGFLTHCGWNSTIESIVEGVPMICWPYFAEQQVNSRFVSDVWKLGVDIKDTCERGLIEKMVRDVMEVRRSEFIQLAEIMAKLASESVSQGGSSYCNLERLIEDIKMVSQAQNAQILPTN